MINYCDEYWDDINKAIGSIPMVSELKGKTIMITGATGLIGSSVADMLFYLNNEYNYGMKIVLAGRNETRMAHRFSPFAAQKAYQFIFFDATEEVEIPLHVDYIIHGASNANPAAYVREPVETMLSNITGTNSLLKSAARVGIKRLLYISSSEVYGNKDGNEPFSEGDYGFVDILSARSCYPSAKRAAETLCVAYSMEYEIDTVIVRPGHIYGPQITDSDNRASAQFTRCALNDTDIVMKSRGAQLRSYCYSIDCASAIIAVMLNGTAGEAYNVSNYASISSIAEIAQEFARTAHKQVVYEIPEEREKKGYNQMTNSSLNSKKIEALGWHAVFSLREGVFKTVSYLQKVNRNE